MYGNKKVLTIGLDFDDTVDKDINLFYDLVHLFQRYGHNIVIVSARQENGYCELLRKFSEEAYIEVVFTGTKAKASVIECDIWIDDFPLAITHDFKETAWSVNEKFKKDVK